MSPQTQKIELLGFRIGWEDSARFIKGPRHDRRAIRWRLAKSAASYASFWRAYRDGLLERLEAFAHAIAEERRLRTCRPSPISKVVEYE